MKKSIKYAGIAAATLLTVAPIAAPVVSNVTTVQAADQVADLTNDNITTAVSSLKSLLTDVTYGDNSSNGSYPAGLTVSDDATNQYDTYIPSATLLDGTSDGLLAGRTVSTTDKTVLNADNADAQIKLFAIDSKGNKINKSDYTKLYNSVKEDNGSIKYSYTIKYNDKDGDAQTPVTGTFTLTNTNNYSQVKALNVTYTNPLEVAYGSKVVDASLSSTIDGTVKDQNGNTIELDDDVATAGSVYKSFSAAVAAVAEAKNTTGTPLTNDLFTDKTFGNADKTYYQPVTIVIKDNKMGTDNTITAEDKNVTATTVLNHYLAGDDDYAVNVNGKALSAVANNTISADGNKLTFIREIHVSQNASWSYEDVTGVVTTKNGAAYYTLKNDDNATISNRALAKNTDWATDQKRTDEDGNVQYRVATGEWIDADNVTFNKSGDNGSTTGEYTDVKALNGSVTTAGPSGYVYPLYDDNGKVITARGVAGESSWYTDKSAVNADGVTVYHVATGEWLQGTNVTYSAY